MTNKQLEETATEFIDKVKPSQEAIDIISMLNEFLYNKTTEEQYVIMDKLADILKSK